LRVTRDFNRDARFERVRAEPDRDLVDESLVLEATCARAKAHGVGERDVLGERSGYGSQEDAAAEAGEK
jgi:hypothetical protein